jgi:sulfonate transport system substrate-binding protein
MITASRRGLLLGAASLAVAPAARAAEVLRIGDQRGNQRAVMEAADVLRDLPFRITWHEFPAAAPLIEAMNAGAIDAGVVGDAPFTFGFASGVRMRVIAARRSTQKGLALLVRGDSPARTLEDLRGRRIATGRGSIGHFLVLLALRRQGWPADAVKLTFMLPADAKAALLSGSVDAWSTWEPYTSQLEVLEGARQIVNGEGLTPGQGFQIASEAAIATKRDQLADFITRLTAARSWANAHRDQYAEIWAKLMGFPVDVPRNWFARTTEELVEIDARAIEDEQRVIDVYAEAGLLRNRIEAAAAFDASFNAAIRRGRVSAS